MWFERLDQIRLQITCVSDGLDGHPVQPLLPRYCAHAPERRIGRRCVRRYVDGGPDLRRNHVGKTAKTQCIVPRTTQAVGRTPSPPQQDCELCLCDLAFRRALVGDRREPPSRGEG
jgi:hypothetical protein